MVAGSFPRLPDHVCDGVMATVSALKSSVAHTRGRVDLVVIDSATTLRQPNMEALLQRLSVRDVLRWARRIQAFLIDRESHGIVSTDASGLNTEVRIAIAKHGMDIFGARIEDEDDAELVLRCIAPIWRLHADELMESYRSAPAIGSVDTTGKALTVGRACVPIVETPQDRRDESHIGLPISFAPT